ncbi:hypothetical protein SAMD00019534_051540, partial [Acytostelium subglobosum LB1]|uniref:hypothetical protein n=1 Tax=Acytostelium subglobosum LB1 TaxID=1410327 RepID=UPI00064501AE
MAGGIYPALKGNSNLDTIYLNITIGPNSYSQKDVIIDLVPSQPNHSYENYFIILDSESAPQTNITFNSLTFTNGSQVILSMQNNINIVLNNITFSGIVVVADSLITVFPGFSPCSDPGSLGPSLTINGGGMINCSSEYGTDMISTQGKVSLNQTEFIGNEVNNLWSHINWPVSIFGSTFMIFLYGGLFSIDQTLFDANDKFTMLLSISGGYNSSINVSITDTTFSNSIFPEYSSSDGDMVWIACSNLTMEGCKFINNTVATTELYLDQSITLPLQYRVWKCEWWTSHSVSIRTSDIDQHHQPYWQTSV